VPLDAITQANALGITPYLKKSLIYEEDEWEVFA
jgi:hypothetical protein